MLETRKRYQQRFSLHREVNEWPIDKESKEKKFLDQLMAVVCSNDPHPEYGAAALIHDMGIGKNTMNKKMQHLTG